VPEKRLPMRRIREVLRLLFEAKLNERQIAKICSVGKGTVRRYLKRIAGAGLSWPLPAELDDATLEQRMFPPPPPAAPGSRPSPDFTVIHKELKGRQNVTLQLLWQEHHQAYPEGYTYSWFCQLYRNWARNLDIVLRRNTAPARRPSWIMPAKPCRSRIPRPARCGKPTSSWPYWVPAVTPLLRLPGRAIYGTGVARTCATSSSSRAPAVSSCRTTGRVA